MTHSLYCIYFCLFFYNTPNFIYASDLMGDASSEENESLPASFNTEHSLMTGLNSEDESLGSMEISPFSSSPFFSFVASHLISILPEVTYTTLPTKGAVLGLANFGNTCYLNAATLLFATTSLKQLLESHRKLDPTLSPQTTERIITLKSKMHALLIGMQHQVTYGHTKRTQDYLEILDTLLSDKLEGSLYQQHDTGEFLGHLLDLLDSRINRFEMRIAERIRKNNEPSTYHEYPQKFIRLPLIKDNTFQDIFDQFFSEELFLAETEATPQQTLFRKKTDLVHAPKTLLIQLNRFSYHQGEFVKDQTELDIPMHLNTTIFHPNSEDPERGQYRQVTYHLKSIIAHLGSSRHAGHYITYSVSKRKKRVRFISYDDHQSDLVQLNVMPFLEKNAYILAYES